MPAPEDRRDWISRAPMWRWRRGLVAWGVCVLVAGGMYVARAAPWAPDAVLRVGNYQGIPGQYSSIQAAVDAARPGDWVLIGPGDYHETGNRVPAGAVAGDLTAGAAVLVTTPGIWIRGMDRNAVVLDGTKPGASQCSSAQADQNLGPLDSNGLPTGRNGLVVFKASGVSVENLTACNFIAGDLTPADEIWFDGGGSTGAQQIGSWRGAYPVGQLDLQRRPEPVAPNTGSTPPTPIGPGLFTQVYANNMADAGVLYRRLPGLQYDPRPRPRPELGGRILGDQLRRTPDHPELRIRPQQHGIRHQQPEQRRPTVAAVRPLPRYRDRSDRNLFVLGAHAQLDA